MLSKNLLIPMALSWKALNNPLKNIELINSLVLQQATCLLMQKNIFTIKTFYDARLFPPG